MNPMQTADDSRIYN